MYKKNTHELGMPRRLYRKIWLIMRLTAIIILVTLLQVNAATHAQNVTLNKSNASLKSVFTDIKKQTGYLVLYPSALVKESKPVTVDLKNVPLKDALDEILANQNMEFEIQENSIVVREKSESPHNDILKDKVDARDIGGSVLDENGNPLLGATVRVKNGNQSTSTNKDGIFNLKVIPEHSVLIITYIGYKEKQISIDDQLINIRLEISDSQLDEVQIQFAGTTSRRISTGNITSIKAVDIEKQPVDNPLLALQGRVPGLIISPSSGEPGTNINLQIRGQNSLTGTLTQPLIVLDGIPYGGTLPENYGGATNSALMSSLFYINPSDIESIDVLKDADATAIYGSRGANGVILITTKKGKAGRTSISLNSSTGFKMDATKNIPLLNTQQYLQMRKEAYEISGQSLPTNPDGSNYDLTLWDQNRYTDWQKIFSSGKGIFSSTQGTISGGNELVQYTIGGTYNVQTSIFYDHSPTRSGVGHFSLTGRSANNKLVATLTANYNANSRQIFGFSAPGIQTPPNAPVLFQLDGSLNWEPDPNSGLASFANPLASLNNLSATSTSVFNVSSNISYQITPFLKFNTTAGISKTNANANFQNKIASLDPAIQGFATGNSSFKDQRASSFSVEPQLVVSENFLGANFNGLIGMSYQGNKTYDQSINAFGYKSDALLSSLQYASPGSIFPYNSSSQYAYIGFYSRLSFNWQDKYIINLNGRRDGSSRFASSHQFGNFGSVGAAWVFSKERVLTNSFPWLSFGKLRFSYGTSGNDQIGDYQYLQLFSNPGDASSRYQNTPILFNYGAVNSDFHWETTKKAEIGLELGFFNDCILFGTSYYRNRSSDQLGSYPLPATAGAQNGTIYINQPATIQNSGIEFTFTSTNMKAKDFSWTTSFNLSFQRNKLLKLPDGFTGLYPIYGTDDNGNAKDSEGKPFAGIIPVYHLVGVDPTTGLYSFQTYKSSNTPTSTDPGLADYAATTVTTAPKYYGGMGNSFKYKNFSLDVFLQFTKQMGRNYIFDQAFSDPGFFQNAGIGNIPIDIYNNVWKKQGDQAKYQRLDLGYSLIQNWQHAANSDAAWIDASFIRVKNISFSYNLPTKLMEMIKVSSARVYLQGENLYTFTKYKYLDPEVQNAGVLQSVRTITAGIQIGL